MKSFGLLAAFLVAISFLGVLSSAQPAFAAVHCIRVYGVMGALDGEPSIQYVELRMSSGGQVFTNGSQLSFFNASGGATGTFTLTSNVTNGQSGASILIGTSAFDSAWAAGSPDFIMPANVMAPNGKVMFGAGGFNCAGTQTPYDSVAYGTGYTGGAEYAPAFASDLPTAGNQAIRIKAGSFDITQGTPNGSGNNSDYEVISNPLPCKNAPSGSPVCGAVFVDDDLDDDGVLNVNDLCPGTAPAATVDSVGCSDAQVDTDGDGDCNPAAPSDGPSNCTLVPADNCPTVANANQSNVDSDGPGDVCDTEGPAGNSNGVAGGDDCADAVDNDGDTAVDFADAGCNTTDTDGDTLPDVSDNFVMVPNMGQENFDGDSQGDACDSEDDGDGYSDEAEGGTPVCLSNVNDDNIDDPFVNDGCPAIGPAESMCMGSADEDGDGRVNDGCAQSGTLSEAAYNIGTSTLARCHAGSVPDVSPSWPSDLRSGGVPLSTDRANVLDLTTFLAPVRYLDSSPGSPSFNSRWDIAPGRGVFTNWINVGDLSAMLAGASGFPAMFGGARAFSGPACTGP